jgi:uncharacterized protein DUF3185
MKPQRLLGIVFLVAGAILLFLATDASHSLSDHVNNVFTGAFTDRTTWLFGGGIACALLGVFMVLAGAKARRI